MATSIIKTDEIRRLNDTVLMSDGALTGNVTFPAGHVGIKSYSITNSNYWSGNATSETELFTGSGGFTSVAITPTSSTSKFLIIGFFGSATIAKTPLDHNTVIFQVGYIHGSTQVYSYILFSTVYRTYK